MYKTWAAVFVLSIISACSLFRVPLQRPTLSVLDIKLLDGNFFQQTFLVRLKIKNPNNRSLPVEGLVASLRVEGEDFASGVSNSAFTVPALGESEFEMTVDANMALGLLKWFTKRDKAQGSVAYTLTGKVSIDLPLLHSIPFQQAGVLFPQGQER